VSVTAWRAELGDDDDDAARRLADLYRREWSGLVRVAYLLTSSMPSAEEIVQDAFGRAAVDRHGDREPRWVPTHIGGEFMPIVPPSSSVGRALASPSGRCLSMPSTTRCSTR